MRASWIGFLWLPFLIGCGPSGTTNSSSSQTENTQQKTTILTSITGASWPTGGPATPGSTGLNQLTAGTWTHVGSNDVPPGSSAMGYIETSEGALGHFRVDNTSKPLNDSNDYWVRFWIYPERVPTQPLADQSQNILHDLHEFGTEKLRSWLFLVDNPYVSSA